MTKATDVTRALRDSAQAPGDVSIDTINDHLGHRSIGALLMIPAALELTPIGAIPGVPTVLATIVAIFAVQVLIGREDMWLPELIGKRTVDAGKLESAADKLEGAARWSDRHLGRHLTVLVDGRVARIAALAILALCCTVPPLELIPFASSIPMGTIVLFGLALLVRDGRVMALAWAAFAAALWGVWTLWP
ncbi:MAG: exopolysaccharide biosynthesis protein [Jannaschia sp.]